jgi:thioredoxin 1
MVARNWQKIGIVALLLVAIAAVAQMKQKERNPAKDKPAAAAAIPRLLDLGADKCTACKMMQPVLADLRKEYKGRLQVDFIDVWKTPDAGKRYRVEMIPTQILFGAKGKELFRHTGFFSKSEILAKFKALGVKL